MSLLNEMLKDLHRREALADGPSAGVMAGLSAVDQGGSLSRHGAWRLVFFVLAVGAALAGYAAVPHLSRVAPVFWIDGDPAMVPAQGAQGQAPESRPASESTLALASPSPASQPSAGVLGTPGEGTAQAIAPSPSSARISAFRVDQGARFATARLELDRPRDFRVFTLADPERVVLEIFGTDGYLPHPVVIGRGPVLGTRQVVESGEGHRVVLELAGPVHIRQSKLEVVEGDEKHRLSIDLASVETPVSSPKTALPIENRPAPKPVRASRASKRPATQAAMDKRPVPMRPGELADTHLRAALRLAQARRNEEAEARLGQALEAQPSHSKAREVLAAQLLGQRRYTEAEAVLLEGLRLSPAETRLTRLYARLLLRRDGPAEALQVLKGVSPPLEKDPEYHAFRAALLQKTGQHADAAALYGRLVRVRPRAGVWWMGLAISLDIDGQPEQALAAYREASEKQDMTPALLRFVKGRMAGLGG